MGLVDDIVREIAIADGVNPIDVPPVGDSVDIDALVRLTESSDEIWVSFEHCGHLIVVYNGGNVGLF